MARRTKKYMAEQINNVLKEVIKVKDEVKRPESYYCRLYGKTCMGIYCGEYDKYSDCAYQSTK